MGENKGKGDEKEKKGGGSEKKKEEGPPKVVLKVDLHCEGCASKIKRRVKGLEGVDGVTLDMASNKLTVIGTADPWKLREDVEAKIRKKVELVSPANPPKKEADSSKKAATGDGKKPSDGEKKPADGEKKPEAAGDSKEKKKPDTKKSKQPAVSIVVLKIRLHCDGCIQRIKKTVLKMKGVQDVSIDAQKDLVTVKGTMDVTALPPRLKEKLNRGVEIVTVTTATSAAAGGGGSEKKDKPATAAAAATEKKEKSGGGGGEGEKKGNGGGEKKGKEGGGGGKKEEAAAAESTAVEANKMEYYGGPYGYREEMVHAPQLFSDENPNACSVM